MDNAESPLTTPHAEGAGAQLPPPTWKLRVVYAGSVGVVKPVPLCWNGARPLGIGRRSESPVAGPWLRVEDERVSREHARIYRSPSGVVVEDLHSRNGSSLNGVRLRAGGARLLRDGDVLRVGSSFIVARLEPAKVPDAAIPTVVGVSLAACGLRVAIAGAAAHDRPLLFVGEPGSGRGLAAQAIHQLSQRRRSLVAVSCETLATEPGQLEERFFGIQRGARPPRGFLIDAHQGSLYLDEAVALPGDFQGKLATVLKAGQVLPAGATESLACDVRMMVAARSQSENRPPLDAGLQALLGSGEVIRVPTLRERREDVLLLVQHFAGPTFWLSPRIVESLLLHGWPRNVGEVPVVIDQLRSGSESDTIRALSSSQVLPEVAPIEVTPVEPSQETPPRAPRPPSPSRDEIIKLLQQYGGNLSRIEAELGYSRRQFHRWIDRYGIDLNSYRR